MGPPKKQRMAVAGFGHRVASERAMSETSHVTTGSAVDRHALPRNLGELVLEAAATHTGTALRYRRDGRMVTVSYPQLGVRVREIARGLIALGIQPGDRVAIFAVTSADWTLADFGVFCAGGVVAPIYHTNSAEECAYVLGHSEARAVFCGDAEQAEKVTQIRNRCPALAHVICFDASRPGAMSLAQLGRRGDGVSADAVAERLKSRDRDDLATLVYTSGTTGPPKGCMLAHGNLLETARMYADELQIGEHHVLYQFLPLAHVLARVAQTTVISAGAAICFWSGDPRRIVDELGELQPTHFPAVPRVYEKIHAAVLGQVQDGPAPQRALFEWAVRVGRRTRASERDGALPGRWAALEYRVADRLVLTKVRHAFGAGLQVALVGAAAVAPELLEFFDACGVLVLEGYGLTESCSVATLNTPAAVRFGTVGRPLPGTEVTIARDGEILIRGPQVFHGYYKDPEATAAALTDDGWLRTGDLGTITPDGFVAITGRKKDLIITSSGKNITPVNIESALRETRYISEAVVYGDERPYLVAVLVLNRDEAGKLAARLGIENDARTLAGDPRVREEIQRDVDAVNARLARIEQIKRFAILDHEFSQAEGELTPTMKVKRAFVYDKYQDVFADLYDRQEVVA
jgi:long-chain acyl-CoA synthetase